MYLIKTTVFLILENENQIDQKKEKKYSKKMKKKVEEEKLATQGQRQSQAGYYEVITLKDKVSAENNHIGFKIIEYMKRQKELEIKVADTV